MAKKLIIHIGLHKTATTTIQRLLESSINELLMQKIFYIVEGPQIGLILVNKESVPQANLDAISRWLDEIFKKSPVSTVVISSENFFGNISSPIFSQFKAAVSHLKYIIDPLDVELEFILIPRRQDSWIEAVYQQWVKWGYCDGFSDFYENLDIDILDWYDKIQYYEKMFPDAKIHCIPFERIKKKENNLFQLFYDIIGAKVDVIPDEIPRINPGLSTKGIEILRRVNDIISKDERQLCRTFLETAFAKKKGDKHNYMYDNQRIKLLKKFEKSNRDLFKTYMPEFNFLYNPENIVNKDYSKSKNLK